MASTITVNNITTAVPGVFSKIDASGLAQVGLSASGVVAILGTATGGLPYTVAAGNPGALPRITSPQALKNLIGSGDLLEAGMMAFDPSADPNVRGGAQIVVPVQVNPETQATLELSDSTGPVLTLSARGFGAAGNALQATVTAGSNAGIKLALKQTATGQAEAFDNLSTLAAIASKLSGSSRLATASVVSAATNLPVVVSAQAFTGGSTAAPSANDWKAALDLLKQARVTEVVVLTSDVGVISAAQSHVDYMCGAGASERQAFVGYCQADGTPSSLSDIVAFIQTIGDRNVQVLVESVQRFGTDGTLRTFPAYFLAAIAAGMRGGAGLGEPLTHKYIKTQGIVRDVSWNPVDNADALIAAGALITQRVDGIGTRFVRDITTYLQDSNLAFVEGSVNASLNYAAYTLRTTLEFAVGRPGFAGTQTAVQTAAIAALALMVQNAILASYTKPEVTPVNDQFQVSVQIAPNLPVNFISITLNVSTPQSLAAA